MSSIAPPPEAGAGLLGSAAVSPVRALTTSIAGSAAGANASRSIRPPASRTTRRSAPPTSIAPSATVCATASACVSPTVSFGIRRNGPGWPRCDHLERVEAHAAGRHRASQLAIAVPRDPDLEGHATAPSGTTAGTDSGQ